MRTMSLVVGIFCCGFCESGKESSRYLGNLIGVLIASTGFRLKEAGLGSTYCGFQIGILILVLVSIVKETLSRIRSTLVLVGQLPRVLQSFPGYKIKALILGATSLLLQHPRCIKGKGTGEMSFEDETKQKVLFSISLVKNNDKVYGGISHHTACYWQMSRNSSCEVSLTTFRAMETHTSELAPQINQHQP